MHALKHRKLQSIETHVRTCKLHANVHSKIHVGTSEHERFNTNARTCCRVAWVVVPGQDGSEGASQGCCTVPVGLPLPDLCLIDDLYKHRGSLVYML